MLRNTDEKYKTTNDDKGNESKINMNQIFAIIHNQDQTTYYSITHACCNARIKHL